MLAKYALGKLPHVPKAKDLRLASYLAPDRGPLIETAMAPGALNWRKVLSPSGDFPEPDTDSLGNDSIGCCVYAAPAHMAMLVGHLTGRPVTITRGQVVDAYAAATGFNPATGSGDHGAYVRDMLDEWRTAGLYGTQIDAYCSVDYRNPDEVLLALFLAGGLIGGYDLPKASQGQVDDQDNPDWSIPVGGWPAGKGPGTWGGHCISEHAERMGQANSWGKNTHFTSGWRQACCGELWMPLLKGWRLANGRAPNGFDYQQLLSDARARGAAQLAGS